MRGDRRGWGVRSDGRRHRGLEAGTSCLPVIQVACGLRQPELSPYGAEMQVPISSPQTTATTIFSPGPENDEDAASVGATGQNSSRCGAEERTWQGLPPFLCFCSSVRHAGADRGLLGCALPLSNIARPHQGNQHRQAFPNCATLRDLAQHVPSTRHRGAPRGRRRDELAIKNQSTQVRELLHQRLSRGNYCKE